MIETRSLRKSFKDVKAVRGVDLQIRRGEFVALLGPNGAGKTTLVEMIEGIQRPDKGEVLIKGKKWKGNKDELHRILGISLQDTRFIDKLTVRETLKLFGSFHKVDNKRVDEVIDLIGLTEKQRSYVVNLSGGQRQKLALGLALLNKPEILLLDEPTTGLDPTARREIWNILLDLKRDNNTTMILTTHYMDEAEYLCERIIIMDHGNVLMEGTLSELLSNVGSHECIDFTLIERPEILPLDNLEGIQKVQWNPSNGQGTINVSDNVKYLPGVLDHFKKEGLNLKSIECRKMTLEDLFISLTGRKLIS